MSEKKSSNLIERIKKNATFEKIKSIKNIEVICALLIVAIVLLIYSSFSAASQNNSQVNNNTTTMNSTEQRLAKMLSGIEGVGDVEIMIYTGERDNSYGYISSINLDNIDSDKIQGVMILAQGADNISTRIKLLNTTSTLLGIQSDKIQIYTLKK